jgi:hypothetical protein
VNESAISKFASSSGSLIFEFRDILGRDRPADRQYGKAPFASRYRLGGRFGPAIVGEDRVSDHFAKANSLLGGYGLSQPIALLIDVNLRSHHSALAL